MNIAMHTSIVKKGKQYARPKFRGNWDNSVICGSRSSNWNNRPLNLNDNKSSRAVTDTDWGPNGLADCLSLSLPAKHMTTACRGLVVKPRKSAAGFL